jgi:hypothetical protein
VSQRCLDFMAREFSEDRILQPYLETFAARGRPASAR